MLGRLEIFDYSVGLSGNRTGKSVGVRYSTLNGKKIPVCSAVSRALAELAAIQARANRIPLRPRYHANPTARIKLAAMDTSTKRTATRRGALHAGHENDWWFVKL